jgi:hypothetical protein
MVLFGPNRKRKVETATVSVSFFDTQKLKSAVDMIVELASTGYLGYTPRQWGVVGDLGKLVSAPVAGWNLCHATDREQVSDVMIFIVTIHHDSHHSHDATDLCHATDREQGHFETVCLFDGDVSIRGLPYRTAELNPRSQLFGGTKTVELYAGDWELRYAFDNFTWTHPLTGARTPLGHPAISAKICTTDLADGSTDCSSFAACPDADECRCSFVDSVYQCTDDADMRWADAARFPPATLRNDFDQAGEVDYGISPLYAQLEGVAEWWNLPQFRAGAARDPPFVVDPAAGLVETFTMRITDGNDDGEEYYLKGGNIYTDSSDLELGLESAKAAQAQWVYTRFAGVAVPPGARVLRAYLTFVVDESDDEPSSFTIYGEADPDSPPIDRNVHYHVSRRKRTTSSVPWRDIRAWATDEVHDSPDLAAIVQVPNTMLSPDSRSPCKPHTSPPYQQ